MKVIMRRVFSALLLCSVAALANATTRELSRDEGFALLRSGGVALVVRHGPTVPGVGDPPGFAIGDCRTQRNLSDEGRGLLRAAFDRTRKAGVRFKRVYTSQWCRCVETAQILVGADFPLRQWPVLNSQFSGNPTVDGANDKIADELRGLPPAESWLLVTHQVNILALTGVSPAPGEGVLVRATPGGMTVLGRLNL
jgi:phosphohistidine phosphatase SixA